MFTTIGYIIIFFVGGTMCGSFGGVILERLSENISRKNIRSILIGRSICPSCTNHRTLNRYELIPIISRIRQKGRCTKCGSPIPKRYLRLEIVSGLVFVITYARTTHHGLPITEAIWRITINRLLLLILIYDLQTQYLHTATWYLLTAVVLSFLITHISNIDGLLSSVYSIAIRGGIMGLIRRGASIYAHRKYGQTEGIGSGDVILVATLAPLLPLIYGHNILSIFTITELFFHMLVVAGIISLILAYLLNQKKSGQEIAFLPGLIIGRRAILAIAPYIP